MGLRDLAHEMFDTLKEQNRSALLTRAFGTLPKVRATSGRLCLRIVNYVQVSQTSRPVWDGWCPCFRERAKLHKLGHRAYNCTRVFYALRGGAVTTCRVLRTLVWGWGRCSHAQFSCLFNILLSHATELS
jgi:hypothetical protein